MIYIYLFYGLAFLVLGLVSAFQARSPIRVLPRGPLCLLAAFGFLHGAHEWVEMADLTETGGSADGGLAFLHFGNLLLIAASFAFLAQFGVELLISLRHWPRWARFVPGALLVIWAVLIIAVGQPLGAIASEEWQSAANALARYSLGLAGSLLAAYALLAAGRAPREVAAGRIGAYLAAAGGAFAFYAFFTGIVVPPVPFPPASWLNTETFLAITGVPVEVFRGISAAAIAGLLSEAFWVEAARARWEYERQREEFISVVAHDLRSPLTAINLNAGLLHRLPPEGHRTERESKLVDNIQTSARSLNRMVEDLLDASRIEAQRLTLQKEKVDVRCLIPEVVDRAAEITKGHPVRVVMPDSAPHVEADPGRVEQVLVNLLANAAKYSYPDTDILVEVIPRPAEVMVSVTNYGPGIPPEEEPRLFTRFYRAGAVERGMAPGLGLGLYISKGLVEAQGGRIWVDSEVGRYATFRFTLPVARLEG